jgi:DNA replication protein DnaC
VERVSTVRRDPARTGSILAQLCREDCKTLDRALSQPLDLDLASAESLRELRTWLAPDLLILDDFGLRKLTAQESGDFYDVLVERDRRAATAITSNRAVDEWVALFDDPILANSALDRFAHRAHQIVMEGPSLRAARAPGAGKPGRRPASDAHG